MSRIILVHGAWHGGWCWEQLVPHLQAAGHDVQAPDLPGHGADTTPINRVSLNRYVQKVADLVTSVEDDPALVVGHSMGGIVISQLAETCPESIQRLIYLCAFLPADGETLAQKNADDSSLLNDYKRVDREALCMKLDPDHTLDIFYQDCDPDTAARATARLCDQPLAPLGTPLQLSRERFGSVPKDGIVCRQDRALTPALQRQMYSAGQCQQQFEIESGHSPFYSMPQSLAELLLSRLNSP